MPVRSLTEQSPVNQSKGDQTLYKDYLVDSLKKVAVGIARTFGSRCEVVLHDLTKPERSIVSIANGHVTGRNVGGSITDLGLKSLKSESKDDELINYRTVTKDGRTLKSSTMTFRNIDGEPELALCINFDMTDILNFNSAIQDTFAIAEASDAVDTAETFEKDLPSTLEKMVGDTISGIGKAIPSMVKEDRVEIVRRLEQQGFFLIKGAVKVLAGKLNMSKFTIYNYLDGIKGESNVK